MTDWATGDLALCIHTGPWFSDNEPIDTPVKGGMVFTVTKVVPYNDCIYLGLKNIAKFHYAPWFRKITPGHPDEFDREVIEAMKTRYVVSSISVRGFPHLTIPLRGF